ncbi:hypothetical protein Moror_16451 [Moniliophthora roreri MCA 2997]|uniref:Uncharacterized protein n=1 Tax=Moniliophthora roreri (strain MCA 2997) TaxID=1381753 RepID=V2XEK3_MONRO|nr:hypothetical protein Moror_16451 [Moniliophthora roreri MCA 2997]
MFSSRRNIGVVFGSAHPSTRAVGSTFGFKGQPSASYVSPSLVVRLCRRILRESDCYGFVRKAFAQDFWIAGSYIEL